MIAHLLDQEDAQAQEWQDWQEFLGRRNPMSRRWRIATATAALLVTGVLAFLIADMVSSPAPPSNAPATVGGTTPAGQQTYGVPLVGRSSR